MNSWTKIDPSPCHIFAQICLPCNVSAIPLVSYSDSFFLCSYSCPLPSRKYRAGKRCWLLFLFYLLFLSFSLFGPETSRTSQQTSPVPMLAVESWEMYCSSEKQPSQAMPEDSVFSVRVQSSWESECIGPKTHRPPLQFQTAAWGHMFEGTPIHPDPQLDPSSPLKF